MRKLLCNIVAENEFHTLI